MDKQQLIELIELYVRTHVVAPKRKVVSRLLMGDDRKSFLFHWVDYDGDVATAIRETVKANTTSKSETIARCKGFIGWLEGQTGESYAIQWPPADVGNRFERIIYIMRTLQTEQTNVAEYLSDKLWVSTRTIEDDLAVMMNEDRTVDGTLLGESLYVNGFTRGRGTVEFVSTIHPVLLLENLTCITLTLHALLEKADAPEQHDWLMMTARHIWRQLTDYAKGRVVEVTSQKYGETSEVFGRLAELDLTLESEGFVTESEARVAASSKLMYAMKAGEPCKLDFLDDQDKIVHLEGMPRFDQGGFSRTLMELSDGSMVPVPFSRVVNCAIEAQLQ